MESGNVQSIQCVWMCWNVHLYAFTSFVFRVGKVLQNIEIKERTRTTTCKFNLLILDDFFSSDRNEQEETIKMCFVHILYWSQII